MLNPRVAFGGLLMLFCALTSSPASAADLDPELLGKWPAFGNPPQAIAVEGAYAYCVFHTTDIVTGNDNVLGIFDVSRPASPTLVGRYRSAGAQDVFVRGNHAYLADVRAGLVILDVSDPARPRRVGGDLLDVQQNAGGGLRFFVSGEHAYVVTGGNLGLYVVDVSDPEHPRGLGYFAGVREVEDVFVAGDLAYFAEGSAGLHIFDVSDPADPRSVSTVEIAARDVFVAGSHAYVKASVENRIGIHVIDVSDPSSPKEVSKFPLTCTSIFVSGNLAYCAGEGLGVFDVSDPANPRRMGSLDDVSAIGFDELPGGPIFVSGGHAYLGGSHDSTGHVGLQVADVSDPALPRWVGAAVTQGSARDVAVSGDHAYVIDHFGLQVFDVSGSGNPQPVARQLLDGAIDVAVSGNHVFVAASRGGLAIFDVTEPQSPVLAGTYRTSGPIYKVVVSGDRAYVAVEVEVVGSGLEILDVRSPASPARVGQYPTSNSVFELALSEEHLYLADDIDATRPESPRPVGGYRPEAGFLEELFVAGRHAYVANRYTGLEVLDVSDPEVPRRVGGNPILTGKEIWQIFVAEGAVFIAAGNEGLFILDEFRDEAGGIELFRRGDSNGDGMTNLSDAVYTLNFLFLDGPKPGCLEAADSDDNGTADLTDPVRLLNYLFLSGPAPAAPGPGPGDCGEDPAGSPRLGCRSYSKC